MVNTVVFSSLIFGFCLSKSGGRLLCDAQDVLWRRKLEEQADLQQAIELQGRRLMGLQLLDVKRPNHYRALSSGAAFPSLINSPSFFNHTLIPSLDRSGSEVIKGIYVALLFQVRQLYELSIILNSQLFLA